MKVYIIGPIGSGKTTLSKKLEKKYNIKSYELDCIVHDDENGHVKRKKEEIEAIFNEIMKQDSWIIEDVGRNKFNKALEYCDIIYYLKISKRKSYINVIKRWFKQKIGKENYTFPPTLSQLYNMIKISRLYFKHEKDKIEKIEKYKYKVKYLTKRELDLL